MYIYIYSYVYLYEHIYIYTYIHIYIYIYIFVCLCVCGWTCLRCEYICNPTCMYIQTRAGVNTFFLRQLIPVYTNEVSVCIIICACVFYARVFVIAIKWSGMLSPPKWFLMLTRFILSSFACTCNYLLSVALSRALFLTERINSRTTIQVLTACTWLCVAGACMYVKNLFIHLCLYLWLSVY